MANAFAAFAAGGVADLVAAAGVAAAGVADVADVVEAELAALINQRGFTTPEHTGGGNENPPHVPKKINQWNTNRKRLNFND